MATATLNLRLICLSFMGMYLRFRVLVWVLGFGVLGFRLHFSPIAT